MREKEKTAPVVSVGADTEQSIIKQTNNSITDFVEDDKSLDDYLEEMQKEFLQQLDPSHLKTISMRELYNTVYQSKPPLIDGLLYPRTYIFAGAPKLGKSFLMAQLAYHISTGTPLWGYKVRKSTVLYFALEDDYPRLQKRLFQMFGAEETNNLYFATQCKTLNEGLDEQIKGFMEEHSDTGLIIIDTLKRVREAGGDNYSYANDYEIITRLKKFADSYGICLLLVHHTRKQNSDDKFDMISGTNGLLGAADGGFILRKEKRTSNSATLEVSGRDQPDQKIYLNRNPETLVWELEKIETELWKLPPEPLLEKIATTLLSESKAWEGTASELCEILREDVKPNVLSLRLSINANRLLKDYGIHYKASRTHNGRKLSLMK